MGDSGLRFIPTKTERGRKQKDNTIIFKRNQSKQNLNLHLCYQSLLSNISRE